MDFEERHRVLYLPVLVERIHQLSCKRSKSLECGLLRVSHEIAKVTAIRHSGEECVVGTEVVFFLYMLSEFAHCTDVIDLPPQL